MIKFERLRYGIGGTWGRLPVYRWRSPILRRWRDSKNKKGELDLLIAQADPAGSLYDRAIWLIDVFEWIRFARPPVKIRFLLQFLDRHPEAKLRVAQTLRSLLDEMNAAELLAEVGLPERSGFWSELFSRIERKLLPEPAITSNISNLFSALFSSPVDLLWIGDLDDLTINRVKELFEFGGPEHNLGSQKSDQFNQALQLLAIDIEAKALSPSIRLRLGVHHLDDIPFLLLPNEVESFIRVGRHGDQALIATKARSALVLIRRCGDALRFVYKHLEEYGINMNVVYLLETIEAKLRRLRDLVEYRAHDTPQAEEFRRLLLQLIQQNFERQSVKYLFLQNTRMLARQIVDRNAETGEHYIARNHRERIGLFKSASGGGLISSLTVYFKFVITSLHLALFFEGFFYSLNYALSFLAIYFTGSTLATKQPAMTGAAIAAKMQYADREHIDSLAEDIIHLLRSQLIGIAGNVGIVIPAVMVIEAITHLIWGRGFLLEEKANEVFQATSLLGPTPLFAAFTGLLLWLSGVAAGWADNWFALNQIDQNIRFNRRLVYTFGAERCDRFAKFAKRHISGIAANASLGFLLGLAPTLFQFFGVHMQVRHVTLQAGQFAAGIMQFKWQCFRMPSFYWGVAGLLAIGILNVTVNFGMSFFIAARARGISRQHLREIYRALRRAMKRK